MKNTNFKLITRSVSGCLRRETLTWPAVWMISLCKSSLRCILLLDILTICMHNLPHVFSTIPAWFRQLSLLPQHLGALTWMANSDCLVCLNSCRYPDSTSPAASGWHTNVRWVASAPSTAPRRLRRGGRRHGAVQWPLRGRRPTVGAQELHRERFIDSSPLFNPLNIDLPLSLTQIGMCCVYDCTSTNVYKISLCRSHCFVAVM